MNNASEPPRIIVKRASQSPLTHSQESLWFLQQLNPDNSAYHSNLLLRFRGKLDISCLEQALQALITRHEPLRTCYPYSGSGPIALITSPEQVHLTQIDLRHLPPEEREKQAREHLSRLASQPYDLQNGPVYRCALLRQSEEESLFFFGMHHIGSDAWSREVFLHELLQTYACLVNGKPAELPELQVTFSDYAFWQRDWMQGDTLEKFLSHWTQVLDGDLPALELPLDFRRPEVQTYAGATRDIALTPELMDTIRVFCRQERVTPFHFFLSAYAVFLSRYSGQEDLLIGCPFANRHTSELENMLGLFINTLPVRLDLSANPTVRQLLSQARGVMADAYTWSALPFEALVARLSPDRDLSRSPVYQVSINMRNVLRFAQPELPGIAVEKLSAAEIQSPLDLTLEFEFRGEELAAFFKFNTSLFNPATISRFTAHYLLLIEEMLQKADLPISRLPMLSDSEIAALTQGSSGEIKPLSDDTVHELFSRQAAAYPRRTAVIFNQVSLSYQELETRANQLANYLLMQDVAPGSIIAILLPRSEMTIVSILAVLKTGCAFMPVDTLSPKERVASILTETQPALVLSDSVLQNQVPADMRIICLDQVKDELDKNDKKQPAITVDQHFLMHIMFTSGSTGKPKGIRNEHRGFVNYMKYVIEKYAFTPDDRMLGHTSFAWDASLFEIFVPLLSGGTLVMLDENKRSNPAAIVNTIIDRKITSVKVVPTLLRVICENALLLGNPNHSLKRLISVGEPLLQKDVSLVRQAFGESVQLINQYGPTECSGILADFVVPPGDQLETLPSVPIGKPIRNNRLYLLDKYQNPVPPGCKGEIYLAGVGVGRGYLGKPDLDQVSFLRDPFVPGEKMYRTGDLGIRLPDGNAAFLGRIDNQVKIRGYRVELTEIESVLTDYPGVSQAVVVVSGSGESAQLVAFLHASPDLEDLEPLRKYLSGRLPFFMLPGQFVCLDSFPLTRTGKIDRNKLPLPSDSPRKTQIAEPGSETENRMLEVWKTILGQKDFGVTDNFFHLGGHSLLAVRLMAEMEKAFGRSLPLVALFQHATVESLSRYLNSTQQVHADGIVPVSMAGVKTPIFIISSGVGMKHLGVQLIGDHPVYALFAYSNGKPVYRGSVQETAKIFHTCLVNFQKVGPYCLLGHSADGHFALELARILRREGKNVEFLGLIDSFPPVPGLKEPFGKKVRHFHNRLKHKSPRDALAAVWRLFQWRLQKQWNRAVGSLLVKRWQDQGKVRRVKHFLMGQYLAEPYDGDVTYFHATLDPKNPAHGLVDEWRKIITGKFRVVPVFGDHMSVVQPPRVADLAKKILAEIDRIETES